MLNFVQNFFGCEFFEVAEDIGKCDVGFCRFDNHVEVAAHDDVRVNAQTFFLLTMAEAFN